MKKKALVILLAVAMVFCFSATAFAAQGFSDMDNASDTVKNAVAKVAALEIVGGYEDGTFRPNDSITRAEFAKMACVAAGMADAATALSDVNSAYSDVQAGAWYTGWINLASSQGYVKGYEDGTFRPNDSITYAEVVTVLLRLLGYTDQLVGPWPINYVNQAIKDGITDDVTFTSGAPALRGDVAVMISAVLDLNMVEYSNDIAGFREKKKEVKVPDYEWAYDATATRVDANGKPILDDDGNELKGVWVSRQNGTKTEEVSYTLLEDSFDGASVTGYVDGLYIDDPEDFEYTIALWETYINNSNATNMPATEDTVISGAEFYELPGHQVTVIYTTDSRNNREAAYVEVKSEVIEVDKVEISGTKAKLDGKSYDLAPGTIDVDEFKASDNNVTGYAYINDDDEVYMAFSDNRFGAYIYGYPVLVTDINTEDTQMTVHEEPFTDGEEEIDAAADDIIILKDGVRITLADVKEGDFLTVYPATLDSTRNASVTDYKLFVVTPAQTGVATRYTNAAYDENGYTTKRGTVTIDGTKYTDYAKEFDEEFSFVNDTVDWAAHYNETVTFALGGNNAIWFAIVGDGTPALYGVVTDASNRGGVYDGADKLTALELFTSEGKTVNYDIDTGKVTAYPSGNSGDITLVQGDVVEYKLNSDGEIRSIKHLADAAYDNGDTYVSIGSGEGYAVDVKDNRVIIDGKRYNVASNVVAFNIKDDYEVELLTRAQLIAGDDITANAENGITKLEFVIDGTIQVVAVTGFGSSNTVDYALVDDIYGYDGSDYITFVGDTTEYEYDGYIVGNAGVGSGDLVSYTVSGSDLTSITLIEYYEEVTAAGERGRVDDFTDGLLTYISTYDNDTETLEVVDDTIIIYCNNDADLSAATTSRITKNRFIYVEAKTGDDADEAGLVVVFQSDPAVIFAP